MTRYIITMELKTSKWKRFLRFFRIIKPREEFELNFLDDYWKPNEIIWSGGEKFLILKKK